MYTIYYNRVQNYVTTCILECGTLGWNRREITFVRINRLAHRVPDYNRHVQLVTAFLGAVPSRERLVSKLVSETRRIRLVFDTSRSISSVKQTTAGENVARMEEKAVFTAATIPRRSPRYYRLFLLNNLDTTLERDENPVNSIGI